MHTPQLFTLTIISLGVTSASPALSSPASATTSSIAGHGTTSHLHDYDELYHTLSQPGDSEDIIVFPDNEFEAGCRFIAQDRAYDLCPLLYLNRIAKFGTASDVGSNLKGKGKMKANEGDITVFFAGVKGERAVNLEPCPKGARTCFIEQDGSSPLRVISAKKDKKPGSSMPPIFVRNFRNAGMMFDLWINAEKTSLRMILTCAGDDELEYKQISDNLRVLNWQTPNACPLGGPGFMTSEAGDGNSTPDGGPSADSPDKELKQDDLPVGGLSRQWVLFIVSLVACSLIISSVLLTSPQARHYALAHIQSAGYTIFPFVTNLKQLTRPVANHFPDFKVGEGRLIRWAQEDMALDGDEDVMVNGSNEAPHGWSNQGFTDEYIPLKSSPVLYTHSRTTTGSSQASASWNHSSYGSVPFEGLDVDETEVDMGPPSTGGMKRLIHKAFETATTKVKQIFRR